MKKRLLTLLTGIVGVLGATSCSLFGTESKKSDVNNSVISGLPEKYIDYFAIKRCSYNVGVGATKKIEVDTIPVDYSDNLIYSIEDPTVCSISGDTITGLKLGCTTVNVSSTDGKINQKISVFVTNRVTGQQALTTVNAINDDYNDAGYVAPMKYREVEYIKDYYNCEGVVDHGNEYYEIIEFDYDEGYFMVTSDDLYVRTKSGSPEKASGKWIFYTLNNGLMTRMVHITNTSKNYIDINTASYTGDLGEIIYDILDCFFVSGHEIVTNLFDDVSGKDAMKKAVSGVMSSAGNYVGAEKQIIIEENGVQSTVVSAEDELDYYDIPAGTECSINIHEENGFDGAKGTFSRYEYVFNYVRDNKKWTRDFTKDVHYEEIENYERYYGNLKELGEGFSLVDNYYDL